MKFLTKLLTSRRAVIKIITLFLGHLESNEYNAPMVHDRFVSWRDKPLVGKSVCARAFFACVRVCVKVIDVCHDASPRMVMCIWKHKKEKKKNANRFAAESGGPEKECAEQPRGTNTPVVADGEQVIERPRRAASSNFIFGPAAWIIVVVAPRFRWLAVH